MTLTKTLKFDTDTLNVIRRMSWSEDGLSAVIHETLDRALYEKVNKALTAMGGAWNRKAQAHLFKTDPRPKVDGLLEAGSLTVERDGFFETPRAVVERILHIAPMEDSKMTVLEPSAGLGAIARVLREDNPTAFYTLIEKNHDRARSLEAEFGDSMHFAIVRGDFLDFPPVKFTNGYDRIYMNPPFEEGQDIDHVRHAYGMLADGGEMVAVMSEGVFFRGDRKATEFREWLMELNFNTEKLPEGSFKESGTGVNTRLVVIKK
jgi:methylase of polypeptide subunit release factors